MFYIFVFVIAFIVQGVVFGLISDSIAQSKGYDHGFGWGFWLGPIGLMAVGFRPTLAIELPAPTPARIGDSAAAKPKWRCACGSENAGRLDYCPICRSPRSESERQDRRCPHCGAMNNPSRTICVLCDRPLNGSAAEAMPVMADAANSAEQLALLEKLGQLHQQGILTDEEFQRKKAEILKRL